jgi:hypothetical protein
MTAWSYAGNMNLNVVADSKVVRDGWVLIDYFQECLVELLNKVGHETQPTSVIQTHETAAWSLIGLRGPAHDIFPEAL